MPPKKKEEQCEKGPLPPCPPKPDICLESGLTPAESAECYEKARWKSPVSRSVKKFQDFVAPPETKCRIKEVVVVEEEDPCAGMDDEEEGGEDEG